MSENHPKRQDFLEVAKHQFAQISAEFEKALEALKDQERRKQMTSSYLDLLQKGLSKAQESVAKYQEKIAPHTTTEPGRCGSSSRRHRHTGIGACAAGRADKLGTRPGSVRSPRWRRRSWASDQLSWCQVVER